MTFREKIEKIFDYEDRIKNAETKEDVKKTIRVMFEDLDLDDIDFNEIIYDVVIPKLRDLNITFDTENDDVIDYEEIMKENY